MSVDPLPLAAAEQARNVAVQMMAERCQGLEKKTRRGCRRATTSEHLDPGLRPEPRC